MKRNSDYFGVRKPCLRLYPAEPCSTGTKLGFAPSTLAGLTEAGCNCRLDAPLALSPPKLMDLWWLVKLTSVDAPGKYYSAGA
jgi:hypothetical protein